MQIKAPSTKGLHDTFTGLSPRAQGIIAIAVTGVALWLVVKAVKAPAKIQAGKGSREEDRATNQELDRLLSNSTTRPTLSKPQMAMYANQLHTAMDGYGTDEEGILEIFKNIKNDADFLGVSSAYGIRTVSSGRFNPEPDFKGTMVGALASELDVLWRGAINKFLKYHHISYTV